MVKFTFRELLRILEEEGLINYNRLTMAKSACHLNEEVHSELKNVYERLKRVTGYEVANGEFKKCPSCKYRTTNSEFSYCPLCGKKLIRFIEGD